jgi:hypothetical protein
LIQKKVVFKKDNLFLWNLISLIQSGTEK